MTSSRLRVAWPSRRHDLGLQVDSGSRAFGLGFVVLAVWTQGLRSRGLVGRLFVACFWSAHPYGEALRLFAGTQDQPKDLETMLVLLLLMMMIMKMMTMTIIMASITVIRNISSSPLSSTS